MLPSVTVIFSTLDCCSRHAADAKRFFKSLLENPSGYPFNLVTVINRNRGRSGLLRRFIPDCEVVDGDNVGWDIGAFIHTAARVKADAVCCFGGHSTVRHPDWLLKLVEAWQTFGSGLYGTNASNQVSPHLATSGFLCPPSLITSHPVVVRDTLTRYDFEHGPNSITRRALAAGMPVRLVTTKDTYPPATWRSTTAGHRQGDQSECLTFYSSNYRFAESSPAGRRRFTELADGPKLPEPPLPPTVPKVDSPR